MSWPFVSRAAHDRELAALERLLAHAETARDDAQAEVEQANRLHEAERRRFDDLLSRYHALKLAGGAVPDVLPPQAPPDPVLLAISRKAGANRVLRTHYARLAHELRAKQMTDEEIVAKIEAGDDAAAFGIPG